MAWRGQSLSLSGGVGLSGSEASVCRGRGVGPPCVLWSAWLPPSGVSPGTVCTRCPHSVGSRRTPGGQRESTPVVETLGRQEPAPIPPAGCGVRCRGGRCSPVLPGQRFTRHGTGLAAQGSEVLAATPSPWFLKMIPPSSVALVKVQRAPPTPGCPKSLPSPPCASRLQCGPQWSRGPRGPRPQQLAAPGPWVPGRGQRFFPRNLQSQGSQGHGERGPGAAAHTGQWQPVSHPGG